MIQPHGLGVQMCPVYVMEVRQESPWQIRSTRWRVHSDGRTVFLVYIVYTYIYIHHHTSNIIDNRRPVQTCCKYIDGSQLVVNTQMEYIPNSFGGWLWSSRSFHVPAAPFEKNLIELFFGRARARTVQETPLVLAQLAPEGSYPNMFVPFHFRSFAICQGVPQPDCLVIFHPTFVVP